MVGQTCLRLLLREPPVSNLLAGHTTEVGKTMLTCALIALYAPSATRRAMVLTIRPHNLTDKLSNGVVATHPFCSLYLTTSCALRTMAHIPKPDDINATNKTNLPAYSECIILSLPPAGNLILQIFILVAVMSSRPYG